MELTQLPLVPIVAFIIASGLFSYQMYLYIRHKKKQRMPSIPNFPSSEKASAEVLETVVVTEKAKKNTVIAKKQSHGLYYAVISIALIGVGIITFSLFSQQKFVYIPRASEGITPTSPLPTPTTTPAPTPTPLSVLSVSTTPSITGTPTVTVTAPSPTKQVPTATPSPRSTNMPTSAPKPTSVPTPTPTPTKTPTLPTTAQNRQLPGMVTPTQTLIAKASTPTPSSGVTTVPSVTVKPTNQPVTQTPAVQGTIPDTGLLVWPIVLVLAGGGLLVLGLIF